MRVRPLRDLSRRSRRLLALTAVAVVAAIAPAAAAGSVYYGFNYLAPNIPTHCSAAWGAGCAHSDFYWWTWSTVTKNSGDRIALGYRDGSGNFYYVTYGAAANGGTYSTGAHGYSRVFCAYWSGNSSYVQCSGS